VRTLRNLFPALSPLLIALLIVAADRITKVLIQRSFNAFDMISLIPGWLRLVHTENPGAAFGVLADGNPWLRGGILIGVSTLVLLFVASALFNRSGSFSGAASRLGLSLILGGAIGNLYDRIAHGAVTDFIEVYHRGWSFPAFNVADSAITVGACLLLIDILVPHGKPAPNESPLVPK
jgi:signal peptidase II